jgi:uncharacterized protein (DUF433 family)
MNKTPETGPAEEGDMRLEYDFSGGVRGKYAERYAGSLIHAHPEIVSGKPVFVGTRVPARTLVEWLVGGHTLDEFLGNFPSVTRDQAVAFLEQAAEVSTSQVVSAE